MGKDAAALPDQVHPLLARIAGQLSAAIFPEGMPWGTRFDALESLAGALGDEIARQMIQANIRHQANAPPAAVGACPTCGHEARSAPDQPRELTTTRGGVAWVEPARHCPHCRRAFFPPEPSAGAGS